MYVRVEEGIKLLREVGILDKLHNPHAVHDPGEPNEYGVYQHDKEWYQHHWEAQ